MTGMDTQPEPLPINRTLLLYAATVVAEIPVMWLRTFICWAVAALLLFLTGHSTAAASNWALIGLWPTIWSISALVPQWDGGRNSRIALGCVLAVVTLAIVFGHLMLALLCTVLPLCVLVSPWATGWWWCTRVGGREPSTREREAYDDAMDILENSYPGQLTPPVDWFVLDLPEPEAAVCGQTLMLTRPMLQDPRLAAVLAHELGHFASWDARTAAAVNRLVIHPLREPHPDQERYKRQTETILTADPVTQAVVAIGVFVVILSTILQWCRGGLGLWVLRSLWGAEWRTHEYDADQYAASLGQGDELADFLETNALIYDQPRPFVWLTAQAHPPTELRIDRLTRRSQQRTAGFPNADRGPDAVQQEVPGLIPQPHEQMPAHL